jgi:hypothetical protein
MEIEMRERDHDLAVKVSRLPDDALVGSEELAALTGFGLTTIRQRKIALPPTDARFTVMKWTMGMVREWLRAGANFQGQPAKRRKGGRPRKVESMKSAGIFILSDARD